MELLNPLADGDFPARTASYTGTAGSTTAWPAGPQGVVIWSTTAAYVTVGEGVRVAVAGMCEVALGVMVAVGLALAF